MALAQQELEKLYGIDSFIDTMALGFSSRVARATRWETGEDVAFKVLRLEHLKNEGVWGQFDVEVQLLAMFQDTVPIVQMIDCGYLADSSNDKPSAGGIVSCGVDAELFRQRKDLCVTHGWRPYVALELLPRENCLLNLVRGADGNGARPLRLPTEEGLMLAMQFAGFLQELHEQDVLYWDHKPEHAYWDGEQLRVLDFNVSRILGQEKGFAGTKKAAKEPEKRKDLHHFVAGILYTVFTGQDGRYQTGEAAVAAPSAPNAVNERFQRITHLDFGKDNSLLPDLVALMNQVVSTTAAKMTAESLLEELSKCAAKLGWDDVGYLTNEGARTARGEVRQGLAALRDAQTSIQKARDHFLQARSHNSEDGDSERLYREASEFYGHRVLP